MDMQRRDVLRKLGGGLAGTTLALAGARAQGAPYPARVVRIINPNAAGGSTDVFIRPVAEGLSRLWGQPVIVESKPGAGGMIAAEYVAKQPADGYTLLMVIGGFVQAPLLYGKANYDPVRDFAAVSQMGAAQIALVCGNEFPARNLQELVAHARALGKPLPYASYGLGSSAHVQMEIFGRGARLALIHVPYRGEAPVLQDLMGGQVPLGWLAAATARRQLASGKLRALAVAGPTRSELLPDVPTFGEAGFANMDRAGWCGLVAPTGTPQAIVGKVSADVARVLAPVELRARLLEGIGFTVTAGTPEAFADAIKADQAYWGDAIRQAGVRLEL